MGINENSFGTGTNISFGSNELDNLWMQASAISLPGISVSPPEVGGRNGAKLKLAPDSVTYTDLTVYMKMDEQWEIYDTIYKHFLEGLNVEKGTFATKDFNLWIDIHNNRGDRIRKFWFYNVKFMDLAELQLDSSDTDDTIQEVSITFTFDYMDYDNSFIKAKLT